MLIFLAIFWCLGAATCFFFALRNILDWEDEIKKTGQIPEKLFERKGLPEFIFGAVIMAFCLVLWPFILYAEIRT